MWQSVAFLEIKITMTLDTDDTRFIDLLIDDVLLIL